jgi:transcription elongation factor GreA
VPPCRSRDTSPAHEHRGPATAVPPHRTTQTGTDVAETWLSQDAYDRLRAELDHLMTEGREGISAEIETARQHGDLRENAEYHAAKDEQGKMEARIRQLQTLLRDAHIGDPPDTDEVRPGLVVVLEVEGDEETYLLGSREDDHDELEILSASSPMGTAITGCKVGDRTAFTTPAGATIEVVVTGIRQP